MTPTRVTDELFQQVRKHYSEAQMVEMAANICLENWRARFNRCFDIGAIGQYDRLPELMAAAGLPLKMG